MGWFDSVGRGGIESVKFPGRVGYAEPSKIFASRVPEI
jgi:hypothetical protein